MYHDTNHRLYVQLPTLYCCCCEQAALHAVAAADSMVAIASAKGLGHIGDLVHFDAAANVELGRRGAAEWLKLV